MILLLTGKPSLSRFPYTRGGEKAGTGNVKSEVPKSAALAVSVSGNWRIIFRFDAGDAFDVDLMDYH